MNSIKSGANTDDVYKPTVYWYPMLQFLDASTSADTSESNLDPSDESTGNIQHDDVSYILPNSLMKYIFLATVLSLVHYKRF